MYISKFYDINGKEFIVTSSITEDHLTSIQNAIFFLQQFLNETDHYITVFQDAKDFMNSLQKPPCNSDTLFIQINRKFSNYLNAFYTWECFHNHKNSWYFYIQYQEFKNLYQAKNTTYGLANQLRHYTTHNGFAISEIKYDVLNEKAYYMITPNFFDFLRKGSTANQTIKQYIYGLQPKGIDARQFTMDFFAMFNEFQNKIWESASSQIQKELKTVLCVVAPTAPDCYNTYIVNSDDKSFHLNIGQILEWYTKRIQLLKTLR